MVPELESGVSTNSTNGVKAEIPGFEPRRSDSKSEMLPITSYLIIII